MKHMVWEHMDKSDWGPGSWQEEGADEEQRTDGATGYPCLLVRNRMGALSGYRRP